MNRNELAGSDEETVRAGWDGFRASLWTAIPGIVESFSGTAMTCVVQPTIQMVMRDPAGNVSMQALPLLVDCPIVFPSGGGCTLTFPVNAGDECLVVFASRCIDAWWQSGGVQPPAELRTHDLSDGFVLVGPRSQPRVLPSLSTTTTQLRSDDGATYIELDPAAQKIKVVALGGFEVNGPFIYRDGMEGHGPATSNGKNVDDSHAHSGISPGSGVSGPVT